MSQVSLGNIIGSIFTPVEDPPEDFLGDLVEWTGGDATIWFGWKEDDEQFYDFGDATLSLEISDADDVDGVRPLIYGIAPIEASEPTQVSMYLPPCWLRVRASGVTGGVKVTVVIVPRTA